jgi:hypothetical protein
MNEQENENLFDKSLNQFINTIKTSFVDNNLGKHFDKKEQYRLLTFNDELMNNIDTEINIYSDDNEYYFVNKEGILVYYGYIDKEGTIETIKKDLTTIFALINFIIAVVTENKDEINAITTDLKRILKFMEHLDVGMRYLRDNHPAKLNIESR